MSAEPTPREAAALALYPAVFRFALHLTRHWHDAAQPHLYAVFGKISALEYESSGGAANTPEHDRTDWSCTVPTSYLLTPAQEKRFWSRVDKSGECWLWTGLIDRRGYGALPISGRASYRASRVSWFLANGPIPDGMLVCHHCDVRHCVNPAHLFLGTYADNARDMANKGRALRGERNHQAKLTAEQVLAIREAGARGEKIMALAAQYDVSARLVFNILTGKAWRHLAEGEPDNLRTGWKQPRRLSDSDIRAIRAQRKAGVAKTVLARQYGVSTSLIYNIAAGIAYRDVSGG